MSDKVSERWGKCVCVCVSLCVFVTLISLPMTEPPEIVIAPSDVAVTAGATILLTCVAIGSPTPSLSWHRSNTGTYYGNGTGDDRHSVYERTETINGVLFVTSIFEICSVEEEEEGEYGCLAENEAGNETARFNVTVDDPFGEFF